MFALKQFLRLLLASVIYWSIVFCLFILIRYFGRRLANQPTEISGQEILVSEYLLFGVILGVMVAIVYTLVEFLFDKFLSKRLHFGFILMVKSFIYLVLLIFSLTFVSHLAEAYIQVNFPNGRFWWRSNKVFWMVTGYFILSSLLFTFLRIANNKFGKGVILNMLLGRYSNPIEVDRILMFVDLKSSTTLAEELGRLKYSRFIQDCFYYLNRVITKYDAEVYQYVGDEAVLTWKMKQGIRGLNCIKLFFEYKKKLKKQSPYFIKKYGVVPEFKAGLHSGKVIIAEVGTIKKELAYHGDVINTTSRIQEECNEYDKELLISENVLKRLDISSDFKIIPLGKEILEGKTQPIKLFAVEKS